MEGRRRVWVFVAAAVAAAAAAATATTTDQTFTIFLPVDESCPYWRERGRESKDTKKYPSAFTTFFWSARAAFIVGM